jgi:hypothetical protein
MTIRGSHDVQAQRRPRQRARTQPIVDQPSPEDRHRLCWYSRRTTQIPPDIGFHTISDGHLLYCAHPMLLPVVGLAFDVANCIDCEYFRARRAPTGPPAY